MAFLFLICTWNW